MKFKHFLIYPLLFAGISLSAQDGSAASYCVPVDTFGIKEISEHLRYLSGTDLKGREAGSGNEEVAGNYIIEQFDNLGLEPFGENGEWWQRFTFNGPVEVSPSSHLKMKKFEPRLGKVFYPTKYSNNGKIKMRTRYVRHGIEAPENDHNDFTGRRKRLKRRIAVIDLSYPGAPNPYHPMANYSDIKKRVETAISHGAKGVILVNPSLKGPEPANGYDKLDTLGVPVIMLRNPKMIPKLKKWWGKKVEIEIEQEERLLMTNNILGLIDNQASFTVIIAAHYDHIGQGHYLSQAPGIKQLHPGADGNSSGVVAALELARQLKNDPKAKRFNYLFLMLSASETGNYGAEKFVSSLSSFDREIAFAINLDMVGRLDDRRKLFIEGIGSFAESDLLLKDVDCFGIDITTNLEDGRPGDHSTLHTGKIPAIRFTTGMHEQYRTPRDEPGKIQIEGIAEVVAMVRTYLQFIDPFSQVVFNEEHSSANPPSQFQRANLGIIPNYDHRKPGLKILMVEPDGTAQKAGLMNGDIITTIDNYPIEDIFHFMDFMNVLKPHSKVSINYQRDGRTGRAVLTIP
ncbi:MAG: M28 family peptidase [Cryomorphaceae bacterium]|nr:M28 family peptidase [Cryomorphaceae bacterium]